MQVVANSIQDNINDMVQIMINSIQAGRIKSGKPKMMRWEQGTGDGWGAQDRFRGKGGEENRGQEMVGRQGDRLEAGRGEQGTGVAGPIQ